MAASLQVKKLLDRREKLRTGRDNWLTLWQDIADVILPNRADFITRQVEGSRRSAAKFDSTGQVSHRELKAAMGAMLMPRHEKWLFIRPDDPSLEDDDAVLLWCEQVERLCWNAIYDAGAQFMRYSGEVDDDLIAFGQGHLWIGENSRRNRMRFRSLHLRDAVFSENADGEIDTFIIDRPMTAEQALGFVGGDKAKLPEDVVRHLDDGNPDPRKKFEFYICICPNEDYDPRLALLRPSRFGMFRECVLAKGRDTPVMESGYFDMPVATPRWDTESGEYNARSPAMIALGDILSSQQIGKTILKAGHLAVEPPMAAPHNAVVDRVKLYPGGITYFKADAMSNYGAGRIPIQPIINEMKLPWGRDIQQDVRAQIQIAFFKNVLNLPIQGPQMTATEIMQRRQEFMRTMGPIFGRLEADYPAKIAMRTFNILRLARALPEIPESLQGAGIRFEFVSPVMKVLKQAEMDAWRAWVEDMTPLAQTKPHIFDHLDEDAMARDAANVRGLPQRWLRPKDAVTALRERRDELQQVEQQKADAERAGGVAANAAKVISLTQRREQQQAA